MTVKQVHPYTLWRVARLDLYAAPLVLKRKETFRNEDYPGYETMNVETNFAFPSESATTYVFGFKESMDEEETLSELDKLAFSQLPRGKGEICDHMRAWLRWECRQCNKYFTSEADEQRHTASRKHAVIASLEDKWTRTMQAKLSRPSGSQAPALADAAVGGNAGNAGRAGDSPSGLLVASSHGLALHQGPGSERRREVPGMECAHAQAASYLL